jgi:hypothetical protein
MEMEAMVTFRPVRDLEDLERCFALRHRVYSVEKRWEPIHPSGLEMDAWDHFSDHVIAVGADGLTAGAARLVYHSPLGFPEDAKSALPGDIDRGELCAFGRLVVAKRERGQQLVVLLGLSRRLMHCASLRRKTQWCALLEAPVLAALEFLGMKCRSRSDPVPHHNTARILVTGRIDQLCDVLFAPDVNRLLAEHGEETCSHRFRKCVERTG